MQKQFFIGNRKKLCQEIKENSILILFSGGEMRKTNDEFYPFYTDRNFLYMTGLESKEFVLCMKKDEEGNIQECVYILASDPILERWAGARIKDVQVTEISGIQDIRDIKNFEMDFHRLASSGNYNNLYLDLYQVDFNDIERSSYIFLKEKIKKYPYLKIENVNPLIRKLRTIKQPCEIMAMKEAQKITRAGIVAMMKVSKPGMYEYQYKAEFDHALGQYGPQGPAFPPIISAGRNNFCIHYYSYSGQAMDGDMILNDVGGMYDNLMNDVSRGWPCNGRFNEKQKLLYECALKTSDYMFKNICPGMSMQDVDIMIKKYNCEMLKAVGVLDSIEEINKYMWHGGAHHVGYDVHDIVDDSKIIVPGMVFCIDVGIYHEEWGIGFRLEDNCLVTDSGCENLSAITPRTVEEIEDTMKKGYY